MRNSIKSVRAAGLGLSSMLGQLIWRDIRSRFIGSASGWIWLILTPLLLLAVYGFVFGVIFRARVPDGLDIPFVAWLAVALWPWLAFSEGVLRGSRAILEHSALISKVAIRRELLVVSSVTSAFLLHLAGYLVVLVALQLTGTPVHFAGLPTVALTLLTLYLFALGLGLGLAAVQVFLRDLEQALPTLFMFWFFLTPILYAPEMLPERFSGWLDLNPMTWWMTQVRGPLLWGELLPGMALLALGAAGLLALYLGWRLFRRLSPYFEDFL
ncbi:ABC transporter permease [Wenzhouxiangella sp. AB-CW3]|uniref:ABC transporter permease n=1 Tax=Wenzhouxiangella sp. AB-CW3 TaxID=2771012 RepID=UPI00168A4C5C|nr:ABC transporter permease [Wenzhouxiangella sp. AB-CW3]QOC23055.1 ABC transporter permease [Wenzhouxiangella sp. AB-CW3]